MRRAPVLVATGILALGAVLAVVVITARGTKVVPSEARTSTAPPSADSSGLVPAQFPQCDRGAIILRYLATGDNWGDPTLDERFGGLVGVPAPQARMVVDQWIRRCDEQAAAASSSAASLSSAEASSSAAAASLSSAAASSSAAAASSPAVLRQAETRSCGAIGGQFSDNFGGTCRSTGGGVSCTFADVSFTGDGAIDQSSYRAARASYPACWP
jgi:hypothetical protein